MGLNTFMFMLRWQLFPLLLGVAVTILSVNFLLTFQGDPPDAAFTSLVGMIGRPMGWMGVIFGVFTVGRAWYKASQLRNGQ